MKARRQPLQERASELPSSERSRNRHNGLPPAWLLRLGSIRIQRSFRIAEKGSGDRRKEKPKTADGWRRCQLRFMKIWKGLVKYSEDYFWRA